MTAVGTWLRSNVGVYLGNATAVRDYRVQLRGNRAVILWSVYLVVLIGFGMMTYVQAAAQEEMSVVEAQRSLQQFYHSIMGLLATMVALIAPALTATSIVAERQRRSLDLVFSAPVSAKYYLVGKMISSYRYLWMLLVLSLPVTAACVVLGGATWSEVLASYALLSMHGLIYTSMALLFSTLAQKPVGAIVWSYIAVIAYGIISTTLAEPMAMSSRYGLTRGNVNEMVFLVDLGPFTFFNVASSYTDILGYHVPNWLLTGIFTLLFSKLMLIGAASALTPYGSPETKSLRIHGLVYFFLLSFGLAGAMASTLAITYTATSVSSTASDVEIVFAKQFVGLLLILPIVLPFISCYGTDLEKKFWPDGIFNIRRMLMATPSGGLPYLLALGLAAAAGIGLLGLWVPPIIGPRFVAYVFYGLALLFACWSVGRLTSAMNSGLRFARTLHFTFLVLVLVVPLPFLTIVDPWGSAGGTTIWDFYILRPLFSSDDKTVMALAYGTLLIVIGLLITVGSERLAKAKYGRVGLWASIVQI